jgi:uncharacterized protein YbaA (DUF1428 family)
MAYVDGFLIPIPVKNLAAYKKMALAASKIWMEHGAVQYCECVGEDLAPTFGAAFPKAAGAKKGETVVFSWVVYKNKKQRDAANKKIMKDPRIAKMMKGTPPFESARMFYGGFDVLVEKSR